MRRKREEEKEEDEEKEKEKEKEEEEEKYAATEEKYEDIYYAKSLLVFFDLTFVPVLYTFFTSFHK